MAKNKKATLHETRMIEKQFHNEQTFAFFSLYFYHITFSACTESKNKKINYSSKKLVRKRSVIGDQFY